jgi:DNA repair exonuclease SbcCD ATPase subunit
MLAETRNELEEFQATSKELEAELEADLLRSDKQEKELKAKVERAESERDEWKVRRPLLFSPFMPIPPSQSKYMSLQTTHNSTTTSLQRELDQLRQEHQRTKVELRDLELGADDLERSKRATSSSLVDMEAKYTKTLEEKIILEQELWEKASLEEEMQRVRDELRGILARFLPSPSSNNLPHSRFPR